MTPTQEQQAIVDSTFDDALKVIAFAGTGKTSTFIRFAASRPKEEMLYVAFNKSVAEEAKRKFGPNVQPKTVHSLAYRWYMQNGGQGKRLENLRYYQVAKAMHLDVYRATMVCNTVENFLNSADAEFKPEHVPSDVLGRLGDSWESDTIDLAKPVWEKMQDDKTGQLSMSHSGYLKLFQLSQPTIYAGTILLDEAQDTNPVTLDLLNQQRNYGTRLLLCGDPFQQIYSWRGAIDAMEMVQAPSKLLTQSFRFGDEVASVANKLLGSFFHPPASLVGLAGLESRTVAQLPLDEPRTIICRTNAELFRNAVPDKCYVVGEEGFSEFLDTVMQVYYLYSGQREKITLRQILFFRNFDALMEFAEERLDNELQSKIGLVLAYKDDIPATVFRIRQNLTTQAKAQKTLVTGHKAKGLEWDNVELAEDFADLFNEEGKLFKVGKDKGAELDKDEVNLLYVALTRAKKRLKLNHQLTRLVGL